MPVLALEDTGKGARCEANTLSLFSTAYLAYPLGLFNLLATWLISFASLHAGKVEVSIPNLAVSPAWCLSAVAGLTLVDGLSHPHSRSRVVVSLLGAVVIAAHGCCTFPSRDYPFNRPTC